MHRIVASICLVLLALTACNLPAAKQEKPNTIGAIQTEAAITVAALSTQLANGATAVSPVSAITVTEQPAQTLTPPPAGATNPPPIGTSAPSSTPLTPTPTPIPCDRAKFVDETVPDGTAVTPGASFTKTWTLMNNGSCTWSSTYSVVFASGDAMGGSASIPLTNGSVAPGENVKISMNLKAPGSEGTFRGNFKLRNAAGVVFGLGSAADQPFWVEIKVTTKADSFVASYCLADWTNDSSNLPCPGKVGDSQGFVSVVAEPKLEDGSIDNEPALWTNPQVGDNGLISGRFQAITVPAGKHFRTTIGCLYGADKCKVKFSLKYIADNGPVSSLGDWTEVYDGKFTEVNVDLSSLAGRSVQFILIVRANGSPEGNQAFWLNPLIQ